MSKPRTITVYTDYKSPYAYLAKDLSYALERDFDVRLDWLPYVLDIPSVARTLLVRGLILNTRPAATGAAYAKIWSDEGSPLVATWSAEILSNARVYNSSFNCSSTQGRFSANSASVKAMSCCRR